jgi:hypothetical protein
MTSVAARVLAFRAPRIIPQVFVNKQFFSIPAAAFTTFVIALAPDSEALPASPECHHRKSRKTSSARRQSGTSGAPVKEAVMNARERRFNVISNDRDIAAEPPHGEGYGLAAAVTVLAAALLIVATLWMPSDWVGNEVSAAAKLGDGGSPSTEFEYFPGKYVNQAKDPEEHIQAF